MASIGMHLAFAAAAAGRRRASPSSSVHRHAARCRPAPPHHATTLTQCMPRRDRNTLAPATAVNTAPSTSDTDSAANPQNADHHKGMATKPAGAPAHAHAMAIAAPNCAVAKPARVNVCGVDGACGLATRGCLKADPSQMKTTGGQLRGLSSTPPARCAALGNSHTRCW